MILEFKMANRRKVPTKKIKSKPKRKTVIRQTGAVPEISKGDSSIRIKKIENGLLVSVSKSTRNKWVEKEYFAKDDKEAKEIVGKAL